MVEGEGSQQLQVLLHAMAGVADDALSLKPRIDFARRRAGKADAALRTREPDDEAAFEQTLWIEREMESLAAQFTTEPKEQGRGFGEAFGQRNRAINGVAGGDERRGAFFDDPGEMRIGPVLPDGAGEGHRLHTIADGT